MVGDTLDREEALSDPIGSVVSHLGGLLRSHRIDLSAEKATQADMERIFARAGLRFRREFRLSARDIPDFFFPDSGLAVEVKVGGRAAGFLRQITRYTDHSRVLGVLLVTRGSIGLPSSIAGKPAWTIDLGRAWL